MINIEDRLNRLKGSKKPNFQTSPQYKDLAEEAQAYFFLSSEVLEQEKKGLSKHDYRVLNIVHEQLGRHCLDLMAVLVEAVPLKPLPPEIAKAWERKFADSTENYEHAKTVFLFVLEKLGITRRLQ